MADYLKPIVITQLAIAILDLPSSALVVCNCSGEDLDCGFFSSQCDAQTCYEYCTSLGKDDFYDLDGYDKAVNSGTYLPFLWTPSQGLTALGSLGGIHGVAIDINDGGQIVGWSYTSSPGSEQVAFLWENGKMSNLNGKIADDSKRTLQSADGINNAGHIVGSMFTVQSGTTTLKSFLLTPNP